MAMYHNLDRGDVLPASFLDALQETISVAHFNVTLVKQSGTTIRAVAGAGDAQATLHIGGLWRYRIANYDTAHPGGAAGSYDLYAFCSDNVFATTPAPDTDNTDYNWYLAIRATGSPPTGNTPLGNPIAKTRKIGTCSWDGTQITAIRLSVGNIPTERLDDAAVTLAKLDQLLAGTLRAQTAIQAGVIDPNSYSVAAQAVPNMTVVVTAQLGSGAYVSVGVENPGVTQQILAYVAPAAAAVSLVVPANASAFNRWDSVFLGIDGSLTYAAGTPDATADVGNRVGAPAKPASTLLLADVLVASGATTVVNTSIRDRRRWARGAFRNIVRNSDVNGVSSAGAGYTTTSLTIERVDPTFLFPRIECSGRPIRVTLACTVKNNSGTVANPYYFSALLDGSIGVNGLPDLFENPGNVGGGLQHILVAAGQQFVVMTTTFVPTADSHVIAPGFATASGGSVTLLANARRPLVWTVEELIRQDAVNG